ncbi:MAG TPA: glycosyltransferase family 4 protein [Polyangiaceae bacterium]
MSNHGQMTPPKDLPLALGLCGIGDPSSPQTWSGTPWQILQELLSTPDVNVKTLDADINSVVLRRVLQLASAVRYRQTKALGRGGLLRAARALKVAKELPPRTFPQRLHLGTLTLPNVFSSASVKDYVFCDATWNTWTGAATTMPRWRTAFELDADRLEALSYRQASHIFSISEYVKDNLVSHYHVPPSKVTVVGTGLGVIKPYHGPKEYDNGKILFVAKGRFEDKGGHLVLSAFAQAREKNPQLTLTIVGQEHYPQQYGNIPGVTTHGFVALEELQNFFNTHSLFVMPALNEPWGLVYLEALACRMPIIGLRRNAFPEISNNGAFGTMVDSDSPAELANSLLGAFETPSVLERTGQAGQAFCLERFTWKRTVAKIVDVIRSGRQT